MSSCPEWQGPVEEPDQTVELVSSGLIVSQNNTAQYEIRQSMDRLNALDRLSIGACQPLRLGRKVGIFPEFQVDFIADDSQLNL